MRVVTNSLLAFMLVWGAGLLSIAQSWAYGPVPSRPVRHVMAWAVSSMGLALPVLVFFPRGPRGWESGEVPTILVIAGTTTAIALWLGSWLAAKMSPKDTTVRQRAFALFWPHLVVLALLGLLDLGALFLLGLNRVH